MPHPGTHIAALRLLAVETPPGHMSLADALGGVSAEPLQGSVPAEMALRHRYACLGALGPDLLYFMLDGKVWEQGIQDYIVRYYAIFRALEQVQDSLSEIWEKALGTAEKVDFCGILKAVDSIGDDVSGIVDMVNGLVTYAAEDLVELEGGINLFSLLSAPRQQNLPPTQWFWADHLHYNKTGVFTTNLLNLAYTNPKFQTKELQAYALGYLSHYIGDVVGHPYVNQVVGGPYRLHRQRHTLVENFIDGFVWTRTHSPVEGDGSINGDKNGETGRPWLDTVNAGQAACGTPSDANFYSCRIDEFIDIGSGAGFIPPLESVLQSFANEFTKDSNAVFSTDGVKVKNDQLFGVWSQMFLQALHMTYDSDPTHPKNLSGSGFPTSDDLAAAYATCLAVMRMQTKSGVEKPEFPDLPDFSAEAGKWLSDLTNGLNSALQKIHNPHFGGSFSLSSLVDWVKSVLSAVAAVFAALLQSLKDLCTLGTQIVQGIVEMILYFFKLALWAAYTALRRVLEVRAYAQPLPDTQDEHPDLTRNHPNRERAMHYPIMEEREASGYAPSDDPSSSTVSQDKLRTFLEPINDPSSNAGAHLEHPLIKNIGQDFAVTGTSEFPTFSSPMDLLFHPMDTGDNGMLQPHGPVPFSTDPTSDPLRQYGGIVPNCRFAIEEILKSLKNTGGKVVIPPSLTLHDYNLDGDRGLGWLCWNVTPQSAKLRPDTDVDTSITVQLMGA